MNIVDKIISPNIWDEVWEQGYYDVTTTIPTASSNQIRSKNKINVIGGETYYFKAPSATYLYILMFDNANNYLGWTYKSNTTLTFNSDVSYILFYTQNIYGGTYNHDICINESNPSINGKYFPYVMYKRYDMVDKPTYELPDGYIPTDIEVGGSYGVVDLGSLTWGYNGANVFRSAVINDLKNIVNSEIGKLLCSKYAKDAIVNLNDKCIGTTIQRFYIKDTDAGTDATIFKNSMQGIYLIYERSIPATPTLVRGNELNKYCIYNGQIGVYSDTFRYDSNIPLKQWLRRLKIGG